MKTIVGGSIASLVTAITSSRSGNPTQLYLPENAIGASFACKNVKGRKLDFGIRVYELAYEDWKDEDARPLESYDPVTDSNKYFMKYIRKFVDELMEDKLSELISPQIFYRGKMAQCIYFCADLSVLKDILTAQERKIIAEETQNLLNNPNDFTFGPRYHEHGELSKTLEKMSLGEMSRNTHGKFFHEQLYESLTRKVISPEFFPKGLSDVSAMYYQKLWLMLYYPITLYQACADQELTYKPRRVLHYPKTGGSQGLVDEMMKVIGSDKNIKVVKYKTFDGIEKDNKQTRLTFDGSHHAFVNDNELVIGVAPFQLFKAAGIKFTPQSVDWEVAWVEVPKDQILYYPSIITIVDEDIPAIRIWTGGETPTDNKLMFTVEFGNKSLKKSPLDTAREVLEKTGCIKEGAEVLMVDTMRGRGRVHASFEEIDRLRDAYNKFRSNGFEQVATVGAIQQFGADALNDQIVQGLYYGAR